MEWFILGGVQVLTYLSLIPASLFHRLEDLTLRDLQKQEREKAANSLEAFIFETQVGRLEQHPLPPGTWIEGTWL